MSDVSQADRDEYLEDLRNEQNYALREHSAKSAVPMAKDGLIARFFKGQDCPDSTTCDIFYVDRTTGREVMRYDGADPANTNPFYGAEPDGDCLAKKGYDIREMIKPEQAVITNEELRRMCRESYEDDHDWGGYDEDYDPRDDEDY